MDAVWDRELIRVWGQVKGQRSQRD